MIKKIGILLVLLLPLISASLTIEKTATTDSIIAELNNTAMFHFKLTNTGATDEFKFYSVVGARFSPSDYFTIASGETKEMDVGVYLVSDLMDKTQIYNFQYKIDSKSSLIQQDEMIIKIFRFKDVLDINSYNINFDADNTLVYFKNLGSYNFSEINADIHSDFFDFSKKFSLEPYEKKEFSIALDKEIVKKLLAGDYLTTSNVRTMGLSEKIEKTFKYLEKAEITTLSNSSGLLIRNNIIEKRNDGNLPVVVQIKIKRNIISRLFTTFNSEPTRVDRTGIGIYYLFQKEIKPSESFVVEIKTNWLYPLGLLIILIIAGYFVSVYTSSDLTIKKTAHFVRTKGGEFALKINLVVKAKKHIERIKIIDRYPAMTTLFEKFNAITPAIDVHNRKLEWNLDSLQAGEERILSYIVFSKIGVVGRFDLPSALAFFHKDGKQETTSSNQVFFLTDTPKSF